MGGEQYTRNGGNDVSDCISLIYGYLNEFNLFKYL